MLNMPCTNCRSEFNLLTWKLKCIECELPYCSKCLTKSQGLFMCRTCSVLNKRPPDRAKLMELKSKDLQSYLNKRQISTYGMVEKAEVVDLFYKRSIPPQQQKGHGTFSSVLGGSVPNLASQTEERLNKVANNLETNLNHIRNCAEAAYNNISRLPENLFQANNNPPNSNPTNNVRSTNRRSSENMSHSSSTSNVTASAYQQTASTTNLPTAPPKPQHLQLSDFHSIEDIEKLSVRQLKEILALNRVNFKGCVERSELQEKVVGLWLESCTQRSDKEADHDDMDDSCKICMDAPLQCVILECGHIATCVDCGKQLAECPICRQFVTRVVRIFKA